MKLRKYGASSRLLTVLQHALYNSTAVGVGRQNLNLASERVDDELNVFGRHSLDSFLHHVIAILILHAVDYVVLELLDQLCLLVGQNVLKSLRVLARVVNNV